MPGETTLPSCKALSTTLPWNNYLIDSHLLPRARAMDFRARSW